MNLTSGLYNAIGNHWDECRLGDERLRKRARVIGEKMLEKPDGLLPQQMGDWAATKSSYRFLDNPSVTYIDLILPHWNYTKEISSDYETVLCIQDTSDISFTHHAAIEGLSKLGNGHGQGFLLHSTLAVVPKARPIILGLLHQEIYYRKPKPKGETKKQRYSRKRESDLWINSLKSVGNPPPATRYIDVMDRGADIYTVIQESTFQKHDFIVRAAYNRKLVSEHKKLLDLIKDTKPIGTIRLAVKKSPQQKRRLAKLKVACKKVTISPPYPMCGESPIICTVIYVGEKRPPKGQEPIEWVLLTSLDAFTLQEACKVIDWYAMRWIIEEYHKCLKTGCRFEQRQLKNNTRLERLMGFLAVVALRLLQLKEQMKNGQHLANRYIPDLPLEVLAKKISLDPESITLRQFWIEVAKMGGFLARKSDGDPGWITIWRGWNDLQKMCEGASIMNCG